MLSTLQNRRIQRFAMRMAAVHLLLGWARGDAAAQDPAASPDHVVVVELFTSQGCSSCPPADRLLTSLGAQGGARVVPLAFHVDFWNSSGWKDPFSQADWTSRQVAYERVLGIKNVYTPQAVVDGSIELIGSNAEALSAAIATIAARPAATIALRLEPAAAEVLAEVNVDVPETLRSSKLDLMFAVYEVGLATPVGRGENGGRTLQNDYVVRSLRRGDRVSPGAARSHQAIRLPLDKTWNPARVGVAVFLQDPGSLRIYGARARLLEAGGAGVSSSPSR